MQTQKIQNPRGYIKFSSKVSLEELETFAQELASDQRFISIYIRKVSKDQFGIGFVSNVETPTQELSDIFFDEVKDIAYRKFGTGVAGWDMASSYILIK
jgi:hypothetical protein